MRALIADMRRDMKLVAVLFVAHLIALAFAVTGMLVFMAHPALITSSPLIQQSFPYGEKLGGMIYIVLGAATMLVFGVAALGRRKTAIFFTVATLLPLTAELIGTSTGWPFGPYEYTDLLGAKILGKVPFTIPLSWFYMGFTAYLLASAITGLLKVRGRTFWSLALGAWLLMAWDLALDPAMVRNQVFPFWNWYTHGVYFGMPLQNFVGWWFVGFLFMGLSRWLWRANAPVDLPVWLPLGMYLVNMAFAMALSLSAGLWLPLIVAIALGIAPASLALRGARGPRDGDGAGGRAASNVAAAPTL
ncbi:MAG TPA: carotenoid biosynthesis protein [Ktedonobacterales bacterium]|jgi:putative membrane protein|nr:carotenoid biosynthesis protein [Ktedonobacterales bacterium]